MNHQHVLTTAERTAITAMAARHAEPRSAAIDALLHVQDGRGWIADDVLTAVAEAIDMSPAELDGIATFYNRLYRQPVGRHVIHACDSMACWLMGGEAVMASLQAHLGVAPGETTADGRFTLLPIQCLGACDRAPAMLVGTQLHTHLEPAGVPAALDQHG